MAKILKNYPFTNKTSVKAPIEISEDTPEWELAYQNWLAGKTPTTDPRWKEGVFLSQSNSNG
jgi:hypothetical protein